MNIDNINKRAASLGGEVLWVRLTDGATRVRVVARPGDEDPWREVSRHFLQNYVQVDDFTKAPVCLGDASCPGCRITNQIRASGDGQSANKAKAQRRFIWVVLSRDNPFDDDGNLKLKLLECPPTVFQGMARVTNEWRRDFTDPVEGFDIEILRSAGSGGIPKYEVEAITTLEGATKSVVKSPLTEEELALVNEAFPNVDELTQPPDYRRFALALGFPVEEIVPVQPTAGSPLGTPPPPGTPPPLGAPPPPGTPPPPGATPPSSPPSSPSPNPPPPPPPPNPPGTLGSGLGDDSLPPENQPAPEAAAGQPAPVEVAAGDSVCPYFGQGYDSEDDACRECSSATACKTQTEAGQEEPPKRRPV
jgi:hypothetical protein